jgi:threonine dehydrogenase-like Zn-dependent dehydrogenase
MEALCWMGVNDLQVQSVPDPEIVNPSDVVLKVRLTTTCGSDLHFIGGYLPAMREGDVIGHEYMGEVVEVGKKTKRLRVGDRVVVPSFLGCGKCFYCDTGQFSICDNTHPKPELQEPLLGYPTGGIPGYTHAFGGYAGSHAEYIRVPHGDVNCFVIPEGVTDEQALFLSDAVATGYMGADFCDITPGDTVAVWGAGAVGLMAMKSALLMGAGRVVGIDHLPERLTMAEKMVGAETINFEQSDSVLEELREMTGGRGPDACIDAVGMEGHGTGIQGAYDKAKQLMRLETDRGSALRDAIVCVRKGGTLSMMGVYGLMDKFPLGVLMNKGITLKTAQQHGQHYMPKMMKHVQEGELDPSFMITHKMPLSEGPRGYEIFKEKEDGCVRAVFVP